MKDDDIKTFDKRINREKFLLKKGLPDLQDARSKMIDYLSNLQKLDSKVLAAMSVMPRHAFTSPDLWRVAYSDIELLGSTSFLARPSIISVIVQCILERGAQTVLEYGPGAGYTSALLALLVQQVDTVNDDLLQLWLSSDAYRELGISNISQRGNLGDESFSSTQYDCVLVSGAISYPFKHFFRKIKQDGFLIAPIGDAYGPQKLIVIKKSEQAVVSDLGFCYFPPLPGFAAFYSPMNIESFWDMNADQNNMTNPGMGNKMGDTLEGAKFQHDDPSDKIQTEVQ